jgi:hypothetical protein
VNGYGVWFDRIPGYDKYALYVAKGGPGRGLYLRADGEWVQPTEEGDPVAPVLVIHGTDWNRRSGLQAELVKALGGLPEAAPDTEVRVLREWLAVEQARVERAFDR